MARSRWRRKLFGLDVRAGEVKRLFPLALAYCLVMMSVYVLKPARNALFLDSLGIGQLPYVLLLVALAGGVTAGLFSRFVNTVRIDRLIFWTFLFLILNLVGFRLFLPRAEGWLFYLFYVWVNLYGLMAISLLWLLANAAFNAREARRLFGFIGTGGIAGAILGGIFTGWAVERLGTENLLTVCMALLAVCMFLVRMVGLPESEVERRPETTAEGVLSLVGRFELLRYLGLMAGLVAIVAAVVDIQFNQIVDETFASKDEKTAFFGTFFAYLNGFAFLFQLLCTPRILRSVGVGAALMFLPLSLGAGSLAMLFIPGLLGGIAVKVGDIGFRHSIHKSATEILFLPVPAELKQRTKVFLDTTVDNLATGLGALFVLLLTGPVGMAYRHLSFFSFALIAIWLALLFRLRRAYVDAFRQALEHRELDLSEIRINLSEAAVRDSFQASLGSKNERQVIYALDLLSAAPGSGHTNEVLRLLNHPSAEVRKRAVQVLQREELDTIVSQVEPLLQDPDPDVRIEAMNFLCRHTDEDPAARLRIYLEGSDPVKRATALGCIASYGQPNEKALVDESVIQLVLEVEADPGTPGRIQAARVLGVLETPALWKYLLSLLDDPSPSVVRAAMRSMGQTGDLEFVPFVLEKLAESRFRVDARETLAAFGPDVLEIFVSYLNQDNLDSRISRNLPGVLSEIVSQTSVDVLMDQLESSEPMMAFQVLKGLNKLRKKAPGLIFEPQKIHRVLMAEAQVYHTMLRIRSLLSKASGTPEMELLKKALVEKQAQCLDRIFRLLGLCYAPEDIYHAYLGITSVNRSVRASAFEFLDNVLDRETKEWLLPFLDADAEAVELDAGGGQKARTMQSVEDALSYLVEGSDIWLRVCAVNCITKTSSQRLIQKVNVLRHNADPLVSETAGMVLQKRGLLPAA